MRNNLIPLLVVLLVLTVLSWGTSTKYRPGSIEADSLCKLDSYTTLWLTAACDELENDDE